MGRGEDKGTRRLATIDGAFHVPGEKQDTSVIVVVEMSQSSWLVAGIVPGISRQPAYKIKPDQTVLLGLLRRWQGEPAEVGRKFSCLAVAFEAGRDEFWPARWLRARGIEAYVIHATSIAVSREHRRAVTIPARLHMNRLTDRPHVSPFH